MDWEGLEPSEEEQQRQQDRFSRWLQQQPISKPTVPFWECWLETWEEYQQRMAVKPATE